MFIWDVIILFLSVHFVGVLVPISLAYFLDVHFFGVFLSHCDFKMCKQNLNLLLYLVILVQFSSLDGCSCIAGYHGDDCGTPCSPGFYGLDCRYPCSCLNGADCDPVRGLCHCPPGYTGAQCQNGKTHGQFTCIFTRLKKLCLDKIKAFLLEWTFRQQSEEKSSGRTWDNIDSFHS